MIIVNCSIHLWYIKCVGVQIKKIKKGEKKEVFKLILHSSSNKINIFHFRPPGELNISLTLKKNFVLIDLFIFLLRWNWTIKIIENINSQKNARLS